MSVATNTHALTAESLHLATLQLDDGPCLFQDAHHTDDLASVTSSDDGSSTIMSGETTVIGTPRTQKHEVSSYSRQWAPLIRYNSAAPRRICPTDFVLFRVVHLSMYLDRRIIICAHVPFTDSRCGRSLPCRAEKGIDLFGMLLCMGLVPLTRLSLSVSQQRKRNFLRQLRMRRMLRHALLPRRLLLPASPEFHLRTKLCSSGQVISR